MLLLHFFAKLIKIFKSLNHLTQRNFLIDIISQNLQNRRMKRKSQIVSLLDELRHQDPKKRMNSVQALREIGAALGPVRARSELIQFLAEFIDDEQNIVLELLNQLNSFAPVLGGEQHQKNLLPLLINFCKTDEKKQAERAVQIIERILLKNKELIMDVIKKLYKTDMNTSKESALKLICSLVPLVSQNESQLLELYSGMIFSDVASYKIIGCKHLEKLLDVVKNKEEIGKMLQVVYNDNDDLSKIFALPALINFYPINNNMVLSKFKALFIINNWRINIKICENVPLAARVFSKVHFKTIFETNLLKCLNSNEPQLRCKACITIKHIAANMTEDEIKTKLIPLVKKLATDSVDYVKVEMSQYVVEMLEVCSPSVINEEILPIIFSFIKNNELALGIIKNFESIHKKMPKEMIEQKILGPLVSQFNTKNWRLKCQLVEMLGNVINSSLFLNDKMTTTLINLVCDKINAVRQKATSLIVSIISKQSPQWCDNSLIPKLGALRQSSNYIERQIILQIIEKTCDKVSEKTLDFYKSTVLTSMTDKVPNVRAKALRVLKLNRKLSDRTIDKYVEKLKNDTDGEVRQMAVMVKV